MDIEKKIIDTYGLIPYKEFEEPLYKYVSIDTAIKIIENSSLKFSIASEFNDPFELTIENIDFTTTNDELKALINRAYSGSAEEKRLLYLQNKDKPDLMKQPMSKTLNDMKSEFGICCFSGNNSHNLMWSHYASNHYGVCLCFEQLPNGSDIFVFHVRYVDKLDPIKYWEMKEKLFPLWVYTKSTDWSYEKEIRAVHTKYNGFVSFEKRHLTRIYYGMRTSEDDIKKIGELLHNKGYKVESYKMERVPSTFSLNAKKI